MSITNLLTQWRSNAEKYSADARRTFKRIKRAVEADKPTGSKLEELIEEIGIYFSLFLFFTFYLFTFYSLGSFLNFLEEELDKSAANLDALAANLDQADSDNSSTDTE